MARYIVIDNHSGYIVGDTANAAESIYRLSDPADIVQHIVPQRCVHVAALGPHDAGYRVYLASGDPDIQFIAVNYNPHNTHVIESVEQCPLVATLKVEES